MDWKHNVCLEAMEDSKSIQLRPCKFESQNQQWTFRNYTKDYEDLIGGKIAVKTGTWQHKLLQLYREFTSQPMHRESTDGLELTTSR